MVPFLYTKWNTLNYSKRRGFKISLHDISESRREWLKNSDLFQKQIEIIEDFKAGKISEAECEEGIKILYSPGGLRDYRIKKILNEK